jgi:hypothetical protein
MRMPAVCDTVPPPRAGLRAAAPPTSSPAVDSAALVGSVAERVTGLGVAYAEVRLAGERAGAVPRVAVTDSAGGFAFTGVPPGRYLVAVRRIGYARDSAAVALRAGRSASLRFALQYRVCRGY